MPEALRVGLVLATSTGGVGRHVRSLAEGLPAYGVTVVVLGPVETEQRFGFCAAGATFEPVELASGPRPVRDLAAAAALRRAAAGLDVLHAHGLRAGAVTVLARLRRPVVVTLHNAVLGSGVEAAVGGLLERLVARGADVVLGASADLVERARALGARDSRFAPVAAPTLPPPTKSRDAVRAELGAGDRPLVLAVGRLHQQKGFDVLVTAAASLAERHPAPLVVIAGEGPAEQSLREQIAVTRAAVALLGARADVSDLLAAADVVVLPSRWEARALVAQEAMRAGRPLIATAVGGLPALVGQAALLVPPDDPPGMSAAVSRLLDDPDEAEAFSQRGRAWSAGWPDEPAMLAQLSALYRELAR